MKDQIAPVAFVMLAGLTACAADVAEEAHVVQEASPRATAQAFSQEQGIGQLPWGTLVDSGSIGSTSCPSSMSHVGSAVLAAIGAGPTVHSELTTCNAPPSDWLFYRPTDGLDFYYGRLGKRIGNTKRSMVISSLNGDDYRLEYLAKGIAALHSNTPANGPKPLVRLLVSDDNNAQGVYDALVQYLPAGGPATWNVRVAAMKMGRPAFETWNHSKLSVQDSCLTTSGSVETNGQSEMFMEMRGDAAKAAERYFDSVWGSYSPTIWTNCEPINEKYCDPECIETKCWEDDLPPTPPCPISSPAGRAVFSLGRGQFGEWPWAYEDLSADQGIFAALEAATEEIFILQRSFEWRTASPNHVPRLHEAIADAASRGVSVRILIGGADAFIPSAEEVWDNLTDSMEDYFDDLGLTPSQKRAAHANVELGVVNTHAKVFMIDRQAFYVGSQNFYPSGLQDGTVTSIFDLYEQGFLVDDATLTEPMAEQADALWAAAQGTILPNPHAWNGNYLVSFQASGSGEPGSGYCNAMFQLEIDRMAIEPPYVDFLCVGQFNGEPIVVDAWLAGSLELDGSAGGQLGGEVYPYSDVTGWSGQMTSGVLSGSFSDLELGVSYSGTFTAVPID